MRFLPVVPPSRRVLPSVAVIGVAALLASSVLVPDEAYAVTAPRPDPRPKAERRSGQSWWQLLHMRVTVRGKYRSPDRSGLDLDVASVARQLAAEGFTAYDSPGELVAAVIAGGPRATGVVAVLRPDGSTDRFRLRRVEVILGKVLVYAMDRPTVPYLVDLAGPEWNGVGKGSYRLLFLKPGRPSDPVDFVPAGGDVRDAADRIRWAQGRRHMRDALEIMKALGPGAKRTVTGVTEVESRRWWKPSRRRVTTTHEYSIVNENGAIKVRERRRRSKTVEAETWLNTVRLLDVRLSPA